MALYCILEEDRLPLDGSYHCRGVRGTLPPPPTRDRLDLKPLPGTIYGMHVVGALPGTNGGMHVVGVLGSLQRTRAMLSILGVPGTRGHTAATGNKSLLLLWVACRFYR